MTQTFPQLRVRTEFSFRQAFGPVAKVAEALAEMKCPAAGIVDGGTWGHVRWNKAAAKSGFTPLFGTELTVPLPDGRKPRAWALAHDPAGFYRFSTAARKTDADIVELFRSSPGIVRFAGSALTDPETFDYIDLNPASRVSQIAALRLHKATGKPLVVTSDNWYPTPRHLSAFLAIGGRGAMTPQHLLSAEELRAALSILDDDQWAAAVRNCHEIAERCSITLRSAPIISVPGDLRQLALDGKAARIAAGHIREWTDEYEKRMERELAMIASKQFESYFIVVSDLVRWAKTKMLVGPARGSSAGSLVCYLLRITEVDPIVHDLLFERFIDVTRKDLPDIDIDFADTKRDMVFDYLAEKYGRECVARIGNVNTLKSKSAINEVCKRFGIPDRDKFDVIDSLIEYTSGDSRYGKGLEDTLTTTAAGKRFMEKHPKAAIMGEVEGHAWHTGVHAAGVIVCNVPVNEYCTVDEAGVAQIDKPDSEALNLLKIDALGLRTLGVMEDAGVATADELYALPLNDPEVFAIFNARKYSGIFQFEGQAQRGVAAEVEFSSFRQIDHVTALARPGPLGAGAASHYIERAAGREEVKYRHPTMANYLGKTMGVVLYQEQVMRICFEIGKFSWELVSEIRKSMSGRKGKEYFDRRGTEFVEGAASIGVPDEEAKIIWNEICTFGAWGMNASHTVSYGIISYWCAWFKRYHPLEYAAACLRSAKDDAQTLEILREIVAEGVDYVPFDPELSEANWAVKDGRLIGGFLNLDGFGPAKAAAAIEARKNGTMDDKLRKRIADANVKFSDLYPLRTAYRDYYRDPEAMGIAPGWRVSTWDTMPESGGVVWLAKVLEKKPRDQNEALMIAKRGGKRMSGPTAFVDFRMADDTGIPIIVRIDRYDFEPFGRRALEQLKPGEDVVLIRGKRVPNYSMIRADKMKCLTRPEIIL